MPVKIVVLPSAPKLWKSAIFAVSCFVLVVASATTVALDQEKPLNKADEKTLIKWTAAMEAQSEGYRGMLAVAWSINNRAKNWGWSISDTILKTSHFSCWNSGSNTRMLLDTISEHTWQLASKAASLTDPDPTGGATHYLNKELTLKLHGKLPSWVSTMVETAKIGKHTFLKETS